MRGSAALIPCRTRSKSISADSCVSLWSSMQRLTGRNRRWQLGRRSSSVRAQQGLHALPRSAQKAVTRWSSKRKTRSPLRGGGITSVFVCIRRRHTRRYRGGRCRLISQDIHHACKSSNTSKITRGQMTFKSNSANTSHLSEKLRTGSSKRPMAMYSNPVPSSSPPDSQTLRSDHTGLVKKRSKETSFILANTGTRLLSMHVEFWWSVSEIRQARSRSNVPKRVSRWRWRSVVRSMLFRGNYWVCRPRQSLSFNDTFRTEWSMRSMRQFCTCAIAISKDLASDVPDRVPSLA